MQTVPLRRGFVAVPEAYQRDDHPLDEVWPGAHGAHRKSWDDLLNESRVVILAEAGSGKTFELAATARRLVNQGRYAFFIRIEDITEAFAAAFEIGTAERFREWLDGSEQAWFFLDSVDEVRLAEPRAFENAIRTFAGQIRGARQRARIYLSSRPYAWRAVSDRALIEEVLPSSVEKWVRDENESPDDLASDEVAAERALRVVPNLVVDDEPVLHLYMLAPLSDADISVFADHNGVDNASEFLAAVERGRLFGIARLPFDLYDLIAVWREHRSFGPRLNILQMGIDRRLNQGIEAASVESARAGAELLAIATVLTGQPNISLVAATGANAIDARMLLKDWPESRIAELLRCGLFAEPIYGVVRFRHREVRELLAACWIASKMRREGARPHLEGLMIRRQYGEEILPPRLRSVLSWMVLFDEPICRKVLRTYPEVALEGGDAASLPLSERRTLLETLMRNVADSEGSLRGLDNAEIFRIAHVDLSDVVATQIEAFFHNDNAIFVLARIVWQGQMHACVAPLASIATDPSRGVYARLVSIRAVGSVGTPAQFFELWRQINAGPPVPRRHFAEIVDNAPACADAVDLALASLSRLEEYNENEVTGLSRAFESFIDRLPILPDPMARQPLMSLVEGLRRLWTATADAVGDGRHMPKAHRWLVRLALLSVERLIEARSPAALSDASLAVLAEAPTVSFWDRQGHRDRQVKVQELVPRWIELNDALYWWTVTERRRAFAQEGKDLTDDWQCSWMGHYWAFDVTDFPRLLGWVRTRAFLEDRQVALSRAVRTYNENTRPKAWLVELRAAVAGEAQLEASLATLLNPTMPADVARHQRSTRDFERRQKRRTAKEAADRTAFAAQLVSNPALVFPVNEQEREFNGAQYHLLRILEEGNTGDRGRGGSDWKRLIPEFGTAVATAYRNAAIQFWRQYRPGLRSEGADRSSVPYALLFAMAGLEIELGERGAEALTEADAMLAVRYTPWELNGFPAWFEQFFKVWPSISRLSIWNEMAWELQNSQPGVPMHYMLHDVVYYAPWLHAELSALMYEWLCHNHPSSDECMRYCRAILMGGDVSSEQVAALAASKIVDAETPESQLPTWFAMRIDADPALAMAALQRCYEAGNIGDAVKFTCLLSVALMGGRREGSPMFGRFKTPTYLSALYTTTHRFVRVAEDIDHAGKGVYSPTLRDDAQDAREQMFGLLMGIPGELAWRAVVELSTTHPVLSYRAHMRKRAYEKAVQDGDVPAWHDADVVELARRLDRLPIVAGTTKGEQDAAH